MTKNCASAREKSLVRSKSSKAFGPVGNCMNSVYTGIPLACHMSHHGESATDIIQSNLMIISGCSNAKQIKLNDTTVGGDRGYNEEEYYEFAGKARFKILHTTKRGPSLCFKFGKTNYKTSRDQRDISENGPVMAIGAVRAVGDFSSHLVAYRNGTGRVTLLQSTDPSLSYGNVEYVTQYSDINYAKSFTRACDVLSKSDAYDPHTLLSDRDHSIRLKYDSHNLREVTKSQGGDEWRFARTFVVTSTLANAATPRSTELLTAEQQDLLENCIGMNLKTQVELEEELSYMEMPKAELEKIKNDDLAKVCKAYGRTYSGKNKAQLIDTIRLGPTEEQTMTEVEKVIKNTLLKPLADKDRSAHKLGSLNEAKVRSIMSAIVDNVGYELCDMWECGFLCSKDNRWLGTSLDGWLTIKKKRDDVPELLGNPLSTNSASSNSNTSPALDSCVNPPSSSNTNDNSNESRTDNAETDAEQAGDAPDNLEKVSRPIIIPGISCGLEIKTPSSKKVLDKSVNPAKDTHGMFSTCFFGDERFKQLVYKPEYRSQVLHHATTANLNYVLFVVASEYSVHYATLIYFPSAKRRLFFEVLRGVYDRCLKWAHVDAWNSNDPIRHMPSFRDDMVSSNSYPVDDDSVRYSYFIWKQLMKMAEAAQLPLPAAKKIVPAIVARWNRYKGRIDEMTRFLDDMIFNFRKGSPKQMLIMREFKKMVLSAYFTKRHCFPTKAPPKGEGYTAIQAHLGNRKQAARDVLHALATTYTVHNPMDGIVPGSPIGKKRNIEEVELDETDILLSQREQSSWQREAKKYCSEKIAPGSRSKIQKFINDELLDRIRADKRLNHVPKSVGSYCDPNSDTTNAATTRVTRSSATASAKTPKEQTAPRSQRTATKTPKPTAKKSHHKSQKVTKMSSGGSTGRKTSSSGKRKVPPRCVVCIALATPAEYDKVSRSVYCCTTCNVHLCIDKKKGKITNCFERWHNVKSLTQLVRNEDISTPAVRKSPRKSKASTKNSTGPRRSPRKRKRVAEFVV